FKYSNGPKLRFIGNLPLTSICHLSALEKIYSWQPSDRFVLLFQISCSPLKIGIPDRTVEVYDRILDAFIPIDSCGTITDRLRSSHAYNGADRDKVIKGIHCFIE